jgi:hypothetical protein
MHILKNAIVATFAFALCVQAQERNTPEELKTVLPGRVLAYIVPVSLGAGLGAFSQTFIFGVEAKPVSVVEITYVFYAKKDALPNDFFDRSKVYELKVVRDTSCDMTLKKLSYVDSTDNFGKPLAPTNVLHPVAGTPKNFLNPDRFLLCYSLTPGSYKIVKSNK